MGEDHTVAIVVLGGLTLVTIAGLIIFALKMQSPQILLAAPTTTAASSGNETPTTTAPVPGGPYATPIPPTAFYVI
jgi:hypothetical protein